MKARITFGRERFQGSSITFGTTTLTNAGSSGTDIFIVKLSNVTGIAEEFGRLTVGVYPNPANGYLEIEITPSTLGGFIPQGGTELKIYDALGASVFKSLILTHKSQIDLSSQPKGIYFIQLNSENGIITKKLIIH